jgi:hypothetical protein
MLGLPIGWPLATRSRARDFRIARAMKGKEVSRIQGV